MGRPLLLALVATLASSGTLSAQETHPAPADPAKPTHGIVRKAPPKSAEPTKPAAEVPHAAKPAAEPVKLAPTTSTEAVAAAIAAAVRSVEEKKKPEAPRPRAVRSEAPRAPQRRYVVRWASPRVQVRWDTPDDRITLSWSAGDSLAGYARDDRGLVP